jgi:hypothetical protein
MSQVHECSLHYLVIDGEYDNSIFAFIGTSLGSVPDIEHAGEPVTLELLPPQYRFGGGGGVSMGRPVLGRWPGGLKRFRQFLTYSELLDAGWVHVPNYRICDSFDDYYSPWSLACAEQQTSDGMAHYCDTLE